jgi:hypothetical protein
VPAIPNKETLAQIVRKSSSLTDVMRNLQISPSGHYRRLIRGRISNYKISTSHFSYHNGSIMGNPETHRNRLSFLMDRYPFWRVAEEMKMSESTVRKLAKTLGLKAKPKGYWRKIENRAGLR